MTAPPTIHHEARLVPDVHPHAANLTGSWFITHGFGKPAAGTYTEVAFLPEITETEPERVLDEVVRAVAVELYGTAWAFHYRPDQYADAIGRFPEMRRRERVLVTAVEVWE
jgi:hypothetical protein